MPFGSLVAVARLTDALGRATTLDDVYTAALDALQQGLGVQRATILLFDEHDFMGFVAWRGISDAYRAAVNGHTPWRPDSENPEPIFSEDVEKDASLAKYLDVFRSEGIRSLAFFPLCYRGRVIGKFMLYYAEPHVCTPLELELARTVAGQIAFGVERVRAEQEIQRQRDRLDDLIASVPGVVWETTGTPGVDQRLTYVSDQIEALTGYPTSDWYTNPRFWTKVIEDEPEPELDRKTMSAVESRVPAVLRYRMRTRDGRKIWAEVRVSSKVENGQLVIRGVTTDVTAQIEAERRATFLADASAALSSSLDYDTTLAQVARLIVNNIADWCAIDVREDETIRRVSAAHRDPAKDEAVRWLAAITPEMHRTRNVIDVIAGGPPLLVRSTEKLRAQIEAFPETARQIDALGLASLMVVPLVAGGRTFGAISIASADPSRLFDEGELAMAVELGHRAGYAIDNARLYKDAQEANRAKDEFLATLSHELRTPMTATLGWASMLRTQDMSPETVRMAIETIERSTRAQAKLIDDILDVSRIVTGKLRLTVTPVNLRMVIDAAVEAIRPSITAKELELRLILHETNGAPVGDAARLQQVIWNLLSNSVKFTHPGGMVTVTLEQPQPDAVRISVRDTGVGISPKLLPYIFDRFRQGDSSTTRSHGGLGLGLAIVRSLVELHGGSVQAESQGDGHGALFTITLPVALRTPAQAPSLPEVATPLALHGVSVLLVEDEDDTRHMLSAALQNFGARVTAVRSVPAALDVLQTTTPTVLVSDIGMPGQDGYQLILKIRNGEIARVRDVPAIALTAYAREEDREKILASGYGYHLAKPVDPLVVVSTVREAAGR